MKKIILIAAICFTGPICLAQFNVNLVVSATPPGTLIDWDNRILTYAVSSAVGATRQAVIKTTLKTVDGTVAATTDLVKARVVTIGVGISLFYPADVLPLEVMVFNGKFKTTLERTGKLLAGNYQLCVQLVTPVDFIPISEERCRVFTIAAFQLPIPVMPANEMVLDIEKAQTVITFRWTPVAPRPSTPVTYRVTVFEILPDQTPMQALRSNQPLLAKDVIGTTQYIWQPQLGLTLCCRGDGDVDMGDWRMKKDSGNTPRPDMDPDAYAFIWTIQTFDQQHRPFGDGNINGDGISEPNVFFIDRRPPAMRSSGPPSRIIYLNNMKGKR